MNNCSLCASPKNSAEFYSLNKGQYICEDCFTPLFDNFLKIFNENTVKEDFPLSMSAADFKQKTAHLLLAPNENLALNPGRSFLEAVKDLAGEISEQKTRESFFPGKTRLFPTKLELTRQYNSILSKLLLRPDSKLPHFIIGFKKPSIDYFDVSIPDKLEWIFSMENNPHKAKMWINKASSAYGVTFFQIISAACTGISKLIDLRELAKNPNFLVSQWALEKSDMEENAVSKIRRLYLQAAAPIFCAYKYRFSVDDVIHHSLSLVELIKIPAVNRWHSAACGSGDFRQLMKIMALMLDRINEKEKSFSLTQKVSYYAQNDTDLLFLKAKLCSDLNDYDNALKAIEKAVELEPEEEVFKSGRYQIMENLPVNDPYRTPMCPDAGRIYACLTNEMQAEEKQIFEKHKDQCPICQKWHIIMQAAAEIENYI